MKPRTARIILGVLAVVVIVAISVFVPEVWVGVGVVFGLIIGITGIVISIGYLIDCAFPPK